jgi:hypothetical protein
MKISPAVIGRVALLATIIVTLSCGSAKLAPTSFVAAFGKAQPLSSNASYNAFGIVIFARGTLVSIYREANTHFVDVGQIVLRTSNDGGATWSTARSIFSDRSIDYRNVAGGATPSGDIVIFWNGWDPINRISTGVFYSRSQDLGRTWDAPVHLSTRDNAYGGFVRVGSAIGILLSNYVKEGVWNVYLHLSSDDGKTWDGGHPVQGPGFATFPDQEISLVSLDDTHLLGFGRNIANKPMLKLSSSDGANTWEVSEIGMSCSDPSATFWEFVSPWVVRPFSEIHRVDLLYAERTTSSSGEQGKLMAITLGPEARSVSNPRILFSGSSMDFGYPSLAMGTGGKAEINFYSRDSQGTELYHLEGTYTPQ